MVYCCVPQCGTDSWRCDPSITFHDFPSSPDLAAKWIQQINNAGKFENMWFPRANSVVCSKHFLSTDYKDDTDSLKPRVVPTVFGHKYIGEDSEIEQIKPVQRKSSGPVIVKIKTEDGGRQDIIISDIHSQNSLLESIINEPENVEMNKTTPTKIYPSIPQTYKTYSKQVYMPIQHQSCQPRFEEPPTDSNIYFMTTNKDVCTDNTNKQHQTLQSSVQETLSSLKNSFSDKNKTTITQKKSKKTANAQNKVSEKSKSIKKQTLKRDNNDNLIEIGPNTFLKINPEIIKVNKKQTPSGNTVLQFLMDQKLANTIGTDVLPKIVQGAISNIGDATSNIRLTKQNIAPSASTNEVTPPETTESPKSKPVVQHVVGHLVDTHICKESCANLKGIDDILMETDNATDCTTDNVPERSSSPECSVPPEDVIAEPNSHTNKQSEVATNKDDSCIAKAPILLTTNMPLAHCFMEKTKYLNNLRQKARQIASLRQKVTNLNKKIEELEDRCVVQERQLSFSFLKKLKTIRKNASKGDPPAMYILEQIHAYTGQKQMRWSDSTLQQCAIWCKKAPYAYEYFKKADFFKLPCLGTVKRFMKKHPEMTFSNKTPNAMNDDGESSSDFNFDEEDSMDERDNEIKENPNEKNISESAMSKNANISIKTEETSFQNSNLINRVDNQNCMGDTVEVIFHQEENSDNNSLQNLENSTKSKTFPVTVDGTSLEVQELILPSGEVVQCYSSNICNSGEPNGQYYIIPSTGDSGSGAEHEYSIVQSADSLPVILQNLENSNLQQEQLIFITNSTDQVECTETEVMTAR